MEVELFVGLHVTSLKERPDPVGGVSSGAGATAPPSEQVFRLFLFTTEGF